MIDLERLLKLMDPDPIRVDAQACLAARHRHSSCRRCAEACPTSALRVEGGRVWADPAVCDRCGICAGVCPTAAVSVRGIDDEAVLSAAAVRCEKAAGDGLRLPCLGYLSVDHLLAMALRHGRVELAAGDCESCFRKVGGELAREAVALARAALAALGSDHAIRLTTEGGAEAATPSLTRRELLSLWRTESAQAARQLLPEPELNHARLPARLPRRRARWLRRLDPDATRAGEMPAGPWKARRATDACTGCGICAAFCPTGSLSAEQAEAGWTLTHQPAACVACGTCVDLCPARAMGEAPLAVEDLARGERRALIQLVECRCRHCRRTFRGRPGETQCPGCRNILGGRV